MSKSGGVRLLPDSTPVVAKCLSFVGSGDGVFCLHLPWDFHPVPAEYWQVLVRCLMVRCWSCLGRLGADVSV
jgi:hypothetical protein